MYDLNLKDDQSEAASENGVDSSRKSGANGNVKDIMLHIYVHVHINTVTSSICLQDLPAKELAKLRATLKRACCPKPASGRIDVNPEIYKQWKAGGASRDVLLDLLYKCDGRKAGLLDIIPCT